ncbi:hypothetical protein CBS101457_001076 [Exobasidium rhododendri]|nr:hypothetical protein CBS101457_001076 [Exobasidium rhododendri]
MSSWAEVGHILANNGPLGIPTSAVQFDSNSEILWTGSSSGQVTSHFGPALQRYTSWSAHPLTNGRAIDSQPGGVKGILCDERAVYSVGEEGIKAANRRGTVRWNMASSKLEHPTLKLSSMCFSPIASSDIVTGGASTSALLSGHVGSDDAVLCINTGTGSVIRRSPSEAPISHIRRSGKYICAGNLAGHIQVRDPRSLNIEHRLHAHPGGLVDMQADGHHLYSVGWTVRLGHPMPEPFVKVHDLRTMRTMATVPFAAQGGPALLAIHPKLSSTIVVAAPSGQFQIADINNLGEASFYQVNTSTYLTSMSLSQSADFIAFGEADGSVRLWASSQEASHFNNFTTNHLEMPDIAEVPAPVNWTTETSLSSIGLPYYDTMLLSSIPYSDYTSESSPLFNPPKKLDHSVLKSMRTVDNISYASLPRHLKGKRNVVSGLGPGGVSLGGAAKSAANGRKLEDRRRVGIPLFRSEREREAAKRAADGTDEPDEAEVAVSSPSAAAIASGTMPSYYQVKTIQYSKFGVEDFDFGFYNQTKYSGLETHIQNSYANAYLQALHYLLPFRDLAKVHVSSVESSSGGTMKRGCQRDNCLLCQAGFLFRMLEDALGANCQATNFLRALGSSDRAASLGLMDKDDSPSADVAYSNLIQTFNRFMLDTVAVEATSSLSIKGEGLIAHEPDGRANRHQDEEASRIISRLFCNTVSTKHTCATCGHVSKRDSGNTVVDLLYPRKALSNEREIPSDFATVLKASLLRETQTKATCRACRTPLSIIRSKRMLPSNEELPQALSVNCAVNTGDQLRYWMDNANTLRSYLPPMISMNSSGDDVIVREIRQDEEQERESKRGSAIYTLRSLVVQVQADQDIPHLVAIVKVPRIASKEEGEEGKGDQWHLFNDFLVRPISSQEALSFPASWKVPAILLWERTDRDVLQLQSESPPEEKNLDLLCQDLSISKNRRLSLKRHTPLQSSELPLKPGTIIAIDSEFVALNQEELELSSDGTRRLIRPSKLTLARVSVLRGEGEQEGLAFVDDFIWTKEDVVDYLTQFSGIKPGDLSPETSKHTLVPLKVAYKKLRMLVDVGCVFLGHGLKKDFRIINIYVPPSQVIDTVDLFQSTSHPRKLSLRFLSWFLLKQDIQSADPSEGHDSIEDALAALKLYNLYCQFKKDHRLEDVLEDLYEAGRVHGWKPPNAR